MSTSNNTKDTNKDNTSWGRASEVSEAMLGLQPYADDSMLFMMRFYHKAQQSLRAQDYTDLTKAIAGLMELWSKAAMAVGGPAERSKRATELREHAKSLVKDFPELERDFDQFVTASRATLRAFNGDQL